MVGVAWMLVDAAATCVVPTASATTVEPCCAPAVLSRTRTLEWVYMEVVRCAPSSGRRRSCRARMLGGIDHRCGPVATAVVATALTPLTPARRV